MSRTKEPLAWSFFASGGMLAALLLPAIVLVSFLGAPLEWFGPQDHGEWMGWYGSPVFRIFLSLLVPVLLLHAAHRLRYTLYDGLQLYHLDRLISWCTYGMALTLSGVGLLVLWVALP